MVASINSLNVESMIVPLNSLKVEFERTRKECKSRLEADDHTRIILTDGRRMKVSGRFWSSFSSLHNLNRSVFDYFSHEEVFERITRAKGHEVRIACELEGDGGRMLSCTNPSKPLLKVDDVRHLAEEFDGKSMSYSEGMVTATFDCRSPPASKWAATISARSLLSRCQWMVTDCRQHFFHCFGWSAPTAWWR